jgi:hypothetical protein
MPTNVSTITSATTSLITAGALYIGDTAFPSQSIIFDLPAGMSPSMFIDNRFTTLNFRLVATYPTAVAGSTMSSGNIRGSAYSWFDRQYINGQNGIIEDITELGLVADNALNYQMSWAQKIGMSTMLGVESEPTDIGLTGREFLSMKARAPAQYDTESMSFSIPVISSLIGVTANKMFNIGRTSKLQLVFNTASIAPITMLTVGANTGGSINFMLTVFFKI